MDKSEKILAAIEQLARNVASQISDVNTKVDTVNAKVDAVNTKVDAVNAKVDAVASDVAELKAGQALILQHLDVAELKGRVEEQSRTIASLIPTKVAAVAGRS